MSKPMTMRFTSLRLTAVFLILLGPALTQTLTGPGGSSSVTFWYIGKDNSGTVIASCCTGLANLYYASSKVYLPASYTSPSFSSSASSSWTVDGGTRTSEAGGLVSYQIKATNPPPGSWESVSFTDGGFTSNTVSVFVNSPHTWGTSTEQWFQQCASLFGGSYSGYVQGNHDKIYDFGSNQLTPIDVHEKIENWSDIAMGVTGWHTSTESIWPTSATNCGSGQFWSSSNNDYVDLYAGCSSGTLSPAPVSYHTASPEVSVVSITQKFFVGTSVQDFSGVCAVRQKMTFETDRGTPSNVSTPPSAGYCPSGNYAN